MSDVEQQTLTEKEERDIQLIIEQISSTTITPRSVVVAVYLKNGKDIVNTILELTF
jgi:Na+-translocating ferredoxin:NAD+ oxidoreductase RnfG subunit